MDINWQQILGGVLIAGITWVASNFLSANKDLAILQQNVETLTTMMKEIRQDQKEQQRLYALRTEVERLEKRIERLEK